MRTPGLERTLIPRAHTPAQRLLDTGTVLLDDIGLNTSLVPARHYAHFNLIDTTRRFKPFQLAHHLGKLGVRP